jgi:hypothetical protein
MADFTSNGAFNINGQWVTSLRYDAELQSGELQSVSVSFRNGRQEVARAKFERDQALELLGSRNVKAIESAAGEQSAGSREMVKGELRGRRLEFRQVNLTEDASRKPGNTIALDSRYTEPQSPGTQGTATGTAPPMEDTPESKRGAPQAKAEAAPFPMPEEITRRFYRVDHKYYFPDRSLAFIDKGTKLKIESENAELVKLALDIAEARGWKGIRVTGTDSFRSRVWREASVRDVAVSGYEPTELERQDVERTRNRRAASEVPEPSPQKPAAAQLAKETVDREARPPGRAIVGKLVEHGQAHYKNDEHQPMSYYATVASDDRVRTLWGVGLEKAIRESLTQPKPGDRIGIQHVGTETVRINVPVKDDQGNVTGERSIDTHRNVWVVEKEAFFAARHGTRADKASEPTADDAATRLKATAALQDNQPEQAARSTGPRSVAVLAIGRVAQLFAEKYLNERDRQRFVDIVDREVVQRQARGEEIPEPRIRTGEGREPSHDMARG